MPACAQGEAQWKALREKASRTDTASVRAYPVCLESCLKHLHQQRETPAPLDWLAQHAEAGQSFEEYRHSSPVRINIATQRLYIRKIGAFSPAQERIIRLTADYLSLFFKMPCQILDTLATDRLPASARRMHPHQGHPQVLSTFLLYGLLKPNVPPDAALMLGFTASDLYPAPSWSYVFGQASLQDRVGVWSVYRFGSPDLNEQAFKLCLSRTLKTASHEASHALSLSHCTAYKCNISGSNHLDELDATPLQPCPQCWAKICWNLGISEIEQAHALKKFWKQQAFDREIRYYKNAIEALGSEP